MRVGQTKQILVLIAINVALAIVAVIVAFVAFVGPAVHGQAKAYDMLSLYEDTKYDFIVSNPSDEQIEQFVAADSADKVVLFYSIVSDCKINGSNVELTMLSIDKISDIEFTQFNPKRIISSEDVDGNEIYIDYLLAKNYGLTIGSRIYSGTTEYIVSAIYKSNNFSLAFVPNMLGIFNANLSCSGVYVHTTDKQAFYSEFLSDYEPLGTLLSRDSFSDDVAYQNYLENFHSRDFSSYIVDKADGYDNAIAERSNLLATVNEQYILGAIIISAIVLLGMLFSAAIFIKK